MFVNQDNSKSRPTGTYKDVIAKIAKDGVCPFCIENLEKYHKNPLITNRYWFVTENMYPYKPSKHHLLFILKRHAQNINELKETEWSELLQIINKNISQFSMDGGTFIIRFGNTKFTGASVTHIHAHLIQSDPDHPSYDKQSGLTMRIG